MLLHLFVMKNDRYDLKDSIKSAERERHSQAAGGHRIYCVNEGSSIPKMEKIIVEQYK